MSLKDVWIYALPSEWQALGTPAVPGVFPSPDVPELEFSYTWGQAVTGYWLPSGPYEVYNVQATLEQVDEIVGALTDVQHVFAWDYAGNNGTGYDSYDAYPTDPDSVLAVMKPHITYDEEGNVINTELATFENPNWGHVFAGQGQRIFAGDYSDDFSTEYK